MLCRKLELIPNKKLDFIQIFKFSQKLGQSPCTIVYGFGQISSKFSRREFSIFILFSDTYTVLILHRNFELILIKIRFFYKFLKLLRNWTKVAVL